MTFFGGAVALTPVVGLVIAACGDASRPPVLGDPDSAYVGVPSDSTAVTKDATPDSSLDGGSESAADSAADSAPVVCNTLNADGPLVPQTAVSGTPPKAMGGQIFTGTYWLTERDTYGTPDGLFVQRSLVFDATTVNVVEGTTTSDAGVPSLTMRTSTYQITDMIVLTADESCPGPPHVTNATFTAVGGQLTLYPTGDTAEVYLLQ